MPSNHLILSYSPLLLPSILLASGSSNESAHPIRWSQYWSFSLSYSPSNEYSGLTSFRIDWFDLSTVQGTFKSFLQHHSSKAPILWHSAFFMVQFSHPRMTTGKTTVLTTWISVSTAKSLLFNMLSVSHSFPSMEQGSFNFMAVVTAMILKPKKRKSVTVSTFSPSIFHEVMESNVISWKFFKCWVSS